MRISCYDCHQVWEVPTGTLRAAALKFRLSSNEQTFVCPNCQARNVVAKQDYQIHDPQIPVVGKSAQMDTARQNHPARADNDPASAPTNPVESPDPAFSELHAIVLEKGLRLLRDHSPTAEVMGSLRKDEHVIILDTWQDGKDLWIQLGPERWSTIEENGEPLIQLLSD
jgi:hypothetical protein